MDRQQISKLKQHTPLWALDGYDIDTRIVAGFYFGPCDQAGKDAVLYAHRRDANADHTMHAAADVFLSKEAAVRALRDRYLEEVRNLAFVSKHYERRIAQLQKQLPKRGKAAAAAAKPAAQRPKRRLTLRTGANDSSIAPPA